MTDRQFFARLFAGPLTIALGYAFVATVLGLGSVIGAIIRP